MKKKLIIVNSLIMLISLLVMLISSFIIIDKLNTRDSNKKINNYLSFATEIFDGNNFAETIDSFSSVDNNIRITIIDLDGNVKADSNKSIIEENHIDRPEIKYLGKIYSRYSRTIGHEMLYIAKIDDGYYLRIAIPMNDINSIINVYLIIGGITLLIIFTISIIVTSLFFKRLIDRINNNVNKLCLLAENNTIVDPTIDNLAGVLEIVNNEIESKIKVINRQKEETNLVLNEMNEGLIALDKDKTIKMINNKAIEIFDTTKELCHNKSYIYLFRSTELQNKIEDCYNNQELIKHGIKLFNRYYTVYIKYILEDWLKGGVILSFIDITDRLQLERTKKDFFANASHELKSPLTCIIGYQQMITTGVVTDNDTILEYSNRTIKEANRMNNIIIDMLNLSNFETNNNSSKEDIYINNIIDDVIDSFDSIIKIKNISIVKNVVPVVLNINKLQATELINNLIDNAIKYNKDNGRIIINLSNNELSVEDNGIGIPFDQQNRVFERFYRVDKAKSKTMGGTGLGLAIVKHVCENNNFGINLESKVDEGTKITITFNL